MLQLFGKQHRRFRAVRRSLLNRPLKRGTRAHVGYDVSLDFEERSDDPDITTSLSDEMERILVRMFVKDFYFNYNLKLKS